jgi:hypothetical protein
LQLVEDFKGSSKEEGDGMIISLLSQGYSHIKIRALFGVGGYRMNRLQKYHTQMQDPDFIPQENTRPTPKHSLSDLDKARVKDHIKDNYDLEEGFACAHRNQMVYFASASIQWKEIYLSYTDAIPQGQRILSRNRWREYVRYFYPHLRLHRSEGDMCNACYRIDISLQDTSISPDERQQLVLSKNVHLGKQKFTISFLRSTLLF